jgi:hypothetical protein
LTFWLLIGVCFIVPKNQRFTNLGLTLKLYKLYDAGVPRVTIHARVKEETAESLRKTAATLDRTVSAVVGKMLDDAVGKKAAK